MLLEMLGRDAFALQMQTIPESEKSVHICLWENFDKTCQPEENFFFQFCSTVCAYVLVSVNYATRTYKYKMKISMLL